MRLDAFNIAGLLCGDVPIAKLTAENWTDLIFILRETKLLASFYYQLVDTGQFELVPDFAALHLKSAKKHALRQAQQIRFEGQELKHALDEESIPVFFLKGASYILRESKNGRGRIASDIDALTSKENLPLAEQVLRKNGWQIKELTEYDDKYYRQWAHEIPPMSHPFRGTVLDLHHNLYLPISGRAPKMDMFIKGALAFDDLMVLGDEATVLHSVIHLYMNEDFSSAFRDLFDLFCLLEKRSESFYENLYNLAEQSGFTFELFCCFYALERYFGLVVPLEIYDKCQKAHHSYTDRLWREVIFFNAVVPSHNSVVKAKHKLARDLVYLRGHFIKMPTHILFKHMLIKSYFSLMEKVFGRFAIEK